MFNTHDYNDNAIIVCNGNSSGSYPKSKIKWDKEKISIGESFQLSLKSVKSSKVKWSSTDKQVATVSKSGKVKGKQEGNCVIIAKYKKIIINVL